jgi:hypothetical protein
VTFAVTSFGDDYFFMNTNVKNESKMFIPGKNDFNLSSVKEKECCQEDK